MTENAGYSVTELVQRSGFDRRTIVFYIQQGLLPKVGRRGPRTRYPAECLTRLLFVRGIKDLQATGRLPAVTLGDIAYALSVLKTEKVRDLVERRLPLAELESLFPKAPPAPSAYGRPMVAGSGWRAAPAAPPSMAPGPGAAVPMAAAPAGATSMPAPGEGAEPIAPAPPPRPSLLERAPADKRSYGLADAGIRQRLGVPRPQETAAPASDLPAGSDSTPHPDDTHPRLPALGMANAATTELGELLRQLELRAGNRDRPPGTTEFWTEIPVTGRVYLSVRGLAEADTALADAVARSLKQTLRGA